MPTAPYDSLEAVMNTARTRLLDAVQSINGEIITDTASFTLAMLNVAWRRLQEYLADRGFAALNRETILPNVPAWIGNDPGVFTSIDWTTTPALPQNMISPLDLFERVSGSGAIYVPMDQVMNGLPTANPGGGAGFRDSLNHVWEWRGEAIYLPGATGLTDIRMRYAGYLADFVAAGTTAFANQPVPIMRCLNSFAWFICAEAARARGDMDAGYFDQNAQDAAESIWNRDYRQGKSLDKRAELGKMPDQYSRTAGANMPPRGGSQ